MLVELGVVEQRTKAVYEVLDGATVTDVATVLPSHRGVCGPGQAACRSLELLYTTKPDDRAMAAAAMSGLRRPNAARGIAATL